MKSKKKKFSIFYLTLFGIFLLFIVIFFPHEQTSNEIAQSQSEQFKLKAAKIQKLCSQDQHKENCHLEELRNLTKAQGLFFAEKTLYQLHALEPLTRRCHLLAHVLAREAIRQNPSKWNEYLDGVDYTTCSAGFFHGILESHIGDDPNFKIDSNSINSLCFKSSYTYYKKQTCVHFMGHLLLLEKGDNLNTALDGCQNIQEGLTRRCFTGVFMEDSYPVVLVDHQIREKLPDRKKASFVKEQTDRCLRYQGDQSIACWIVMAENFKEYYDNPQKVYDACSEAPLESAHHECYLKASGLFLLTPNFASDENLASICAPTKSIEELYRRCVGNVISYSLYYSPKFAPKGAQFCENVEEWYIKECFSELKDKINKVASESKSGIIEFCQNLPEEHKDLCLSK